MGYSMVLAILKGKKVESFVLGTKPKLAGLISFFDETISEGGTKVMLLHTS